MAFTDLTSRGAVLAALREFDDLGREKFLAKYGFGEARHYFVLHNGKRYDSKAIVGAAHRFQFPEQGPLTSADFSGGDATVKSKLEGLGFSVVVEEEDDAEAMALVLVEAEETAGGMHDDWKDVTGAQYHYPNQYKNRITPGRRFIYYRGIRRAGGKRGPAEYFGCGTIGDVRVDPDTARSPKKDQHWFCGIDDYVPFATPVAAKLADGTFLEQVQHQNLWGVGVREIPLAVYERILTEAGIAPRNGNVPAPAPDDVAPSLPPLGNVNPSFATNMSEVLKPQLSMPFEGGPAAARQAKRRSKHSKAIGDRAEAIVHAALEKEGVNGLRWPARDGQTPGWDIEYTASDGQFVAVEVKGTTGSAFASFEMTNGEWLQAQELRSRYLLYLVSKCASIEPVITKIGDPVGRTDFEVMPVLWRIIARR